MLSHRSPHQESSDKPHGTPEMCSVRAQGRSQARAQTLNAIVEGSPPAGSCSGQVGRQQALNPGPVRWEGLCTEKVKLITVEFKGIKYLPLPRTVQKLKTWGKACERPASAMQSGVSAGLRQPVPLSPAAQGPVVSQREVEAVLDSEPAKCELLRRTFLSFAWTSTWRSHSDSKLKCRKQFWRSEGRFYPKNQTHALSLHSTHIQLHSLLFFNVTEFTVFGSWNCAAVCCKTMMLLWWSRICFSLSS